MSAENNQVSVPLIIGISTAAVILVWMAYAFCDTTIRDKGHIFKPDPEEMAFIRRVASDPYYKSLSPERKEKIKREFSNMEFTNRITHEYELPPEDLQFLRKKGILSVPSFPGYITYAAQGGVFVLVPGEEEDIDTTRSDQQVVY